MRRLALVIALGATGSALWLAISVARFGPVVVAGPGSSGPILRADSLAVAMLLLVSFIGVVVLRFSHAYLHGNPRQSAFLRDLCLTLASVSLLATAGNAWLLWCAWVAMSLLLHRLLLFRADRARARAAARKKFIMARGSDVLLAMGLLSLSVSAGSADLSAIAALVVAQPPGSFSGPALLLVFAAALKSAQFPTHGWLTEVIEAPTPVSALLHAGVINAGGFLLLRNAEVIAASPAALYLLIVAGAVTALFASLVMVTQSAVKTALAWSTVAQMGFMLLQCGLGLFSSAMLHILAHALYKAHAFLSSGSVVDLARGSGAQADAAPLSPGLLVASLLVAATLLILLSSLFAVAPGSRPALVGLGGILLLGLVHLVVQSAREAPSPQVLLRVVTGAALVAALYFALQSTAAAVFRGALPATVPLDPVQLCLMLVALCGFATASALQWAMPTLQRSRRGRALWVHLANGLYVNLLLDRLLDALGDVDERRRRGVVREAQQ